MPFSAAASISSDPPDPVPSRATGGWLRDLSDEAIATLIQYTAPQGGPPAIVFSEVRHAGGAVNRVDPDANAFGHRDKELLMNAIAMTPTPEAYAHAGEHMAAMRRALAPVEAGVYPSFLDGNEQRTRIADAYPPEKYRRLQAIKAKYDPHNLFARSFNVPPATGGNGQG
jgi:hypothetical protein